MCLSVDWTKQPSIFRGHLWQEKRVMAKLSHMRSRYHWCRLEVDKRDLQPTAKLLTQQKHLLSCMIFSLVTMCMSEHTLKLALDHMVNPYLWNWVSNVSHTFFIAISCTFFSHSHYLIYSYYNMDYLYKLKTIEK